MQWQHAMGLQEPPSKFAGYGLAPGSYSLAPTANRDGVISSGSGPITATYTAVRDGTGLVTGQSIIGDSYQSIKGGQAQIYFEQAFLEFDTYTSGTISSAILRMFCVLKAGGSSGQHGFLVAPYDYGTSVTTADFIPGGSLPTSVGTLAYSTTTNGVLNDFSDTGAGQKSAVNTSGLTRLVVLSDYQVNTTAAVGAYGNTTITPASCRLDLVIL